MKWLMGICLALVLGMGLASMALEAKPVTPVTAEGWVLACIGEGGQPNDCVAAYEALSRG